MREGTAACPRDVRDTDKPAPVHRQTHKDLKAIVEAIAARKAKLAEVLVADHLIRAPATINIWQ